MTARRGLDPPLEFVLDVNVPFAEVPSKVSLKNRPSLLHKKREQKQ